MIRRLGLLAIAVITISASVAAAQPDRNAFPVFHKGDGPLGYGKPTKTVVDMKAWQHPTKGALATLNQAQVVRVEFYNGGTYPVFFVQRGPATTTFRYLQLHETDKMNRYARRILKANASWAFEVVDGGDRFRSNAARVHKGSDAFDGPGDDDGFISE